MNVVGRAVLVVAGIATVIVLVSLRGEEPASLEVGASAPEYGAPSLAGDTISLADHRGQVVLVNVWATWCGPCRVEMPSIQAVFDRYHDQGFRVLAVAIDAGSEPEKKVEAFVAELGLTFPILMDSEGRVNRTFQIAGVPETFVIDRDGRIVKRVIGASDWDSESNRALIEELLRM